MLVDE